MHSQSGRSKEAGRQLRLGPSLVRNHDSHFGIVHRLDSCFETALQTHIDTLRKHHRTTIKLDYNMAPSRTDAAEISFATREDQSSHKNVDLDPPFLAKPSGACCLEGKIHTGNPRGSFTSIAGVETYIVEPTVNKRNGNILLYYPDVWGMFTNGLLVMDGFADAGYLTIGLDYFRGVSR